MFFTRLNVLAVLAPSVVLGATYTVTLSSETSSSVVCRTYFKTTSVAPVPTHYSSKNLPPDYSIYSVTSTPYSTVTPKPTTSTSTSVIVSTTTTTVTPSTDTFSTTSTITDVTTTTSTSTETDTVTTSTISTSTSTTVVPAPSGFMPVTETSGDSNYTAPEKLKREEDAIEHLKGRETSERPPHMFAAYQYPAKVSCVTSYQPVYTLEVIKVHSTAKTTAAQSTVTAVVTSTAVSTSTVVPSSVSTTLSFSTTTTSTSTTYTATTTTVTSTVTTTLAVSETLYAQCASNNLLGSRLQDDDYIYTTEGFNKDGTAYISTTTTDSAYDCCAACAEATDNCQYGVWTSTYSPNCYLTEDSTTCGATQSYDGVFYDSSGSNSYDEIAFNGACGYMKDGGI